MKYIVLIIMLSAFGCANQRTVNPFQNNNDFVYYEGLKISHRKIMDHWLTELSEKNAPLYVAIANAVVLSERHDKKVFILKSYIKKTPVYKLSYATGHGQDVISIDVNKNEINFDHYNEGDGPPFADSTEALWLEQKVYEINSRIHKSFN